MIDYTYQGLPMGENIYKHQNGQWYVRIQLHGKRIHRAAGSTKRAAELLLAQLVQASERSTLGLPIRNDRTLEEWAPEYLEWAKATKRSWQSDEWRLKQLLATFGHVKLQDITRQKVQLWMQERLSTNSYFKKPYSKASVNRLAALIKKMLSLAVERGVIEANPLKGLKLYQEEGRVRVLSADDERRLLEAAPLWLAWLIRLAIATGVRRSELVALKWEHIDFERGMIAIQRSKGKKPRVIPIAADLVEELRQRRGLPGGSVAFAEDGQKIDTWISQAFRLAADKAGLKDLRFHDLRHVMGTRLRAAGATTLDLQEILGHSSASMSQRYAHPTQEHMAGLVAGARTKAFNEEVLLDGLSRDEQERLLAALKRRLKRKVQS